MGSDIVNKRRLNVNDAVRGERSTQLPYLSDSSDTTGQILLHYK